MCIPTALVWTTQCPGSCVWMCISCLQTLAKKLFTLWIRWSSLHDGHDCEHCKNGWPDHDSVSGKTRVAPKNCNWWGCILAPRGKYDWIIHAVAVIRGFVAITAAACWITCSQVLAKKVFTLYSLAVQQLSKQDHYDFGLRALVSVLRYAGRKKRANPNMQDEEVSLSFSPEDVKYF